MPKCTVKSSASDDDGGGLKKKRHNDSLRKPYPQYSEKSLCIMQRMGFTGQQQGLGKQGQGRLEPIEASVQNGRRGFGLKVNDFHKLRATKWTPDMETIQLREPTSFIYDSSDDLETKSYDTLSAWMITGPKKLTIDDETKFCCPDVLRNVLAAKTIFNQLRGYEIAIARSRFNPFETIGKSIFINRSAVKMANMDALFEFMFTRPIDEAGRSLVKDNELFCFADVCAGPGGFSQYGKFFLGNTQFNAKYQLVIFLFNPIQFCGAINGRQRDLVLHYVVRMILC